MTDRERRIDEAIAAYILAREAGRAPPPEEFVAAHPDLADELRSFLDAEGALRRFDPRRTLAEAAAPSVLPYIGDYEILGEIARGGMGVVYKARQATLGREVAVKMLLAGTLAGPDEVARFLREARAAATLDHPNVCPIHEVNEHQGQHYYSMKLIDGGSLAARLPALVTRPREAAAILVDVCRAVQHAHERGVIHRDLKPANVLLDREGTPYVTDFGLARPVGGDAGLTRTGAIVGTPAYMAPEQAAARKGLTPAVDVYALGAILYECLAGQPPFTGPSPLDVVMQVIGRDPVPPRVVNAKAPRDLETVCLKCLEKEPTKRYASAVALGDDLQRWLDGRPIVARPAGPTDRAWRWARRNPAVATLSAAMAVLMAAATALSLGLAAWALGEKGRAERATAEAKGHAARATAEAFRAEDGRHGIQMNVALQAWERHDLTRAEALLDDVHPALRGAWETRLLRRLSETRGRRLAGHGGWVHGVAWSADGSRLASCAEDRTIRLWDAATGRPVRTLPLESRASYRVAFSPDGTRLASGGDDAVLVWDVTTGRRLMTLKEHAGPAWAVAWSGDGRRLASGGEDHAVKVWDAATGRCLRTLNGHTNNVPAVALDRDGRRVVSVSWDGTAVVWDADKGEKVTTFRGHTGWVTGVAINPEGTRVVSGGADRAVRIWDAASGKPGAVMKGHVLDVQDVAFGPGGAYVASAAPDSVRVWDARTGAEVFALHGHSDWVTSVAFAPDGRLVSGGRDKQLRVWVPSAGPRVGPAGAFARAADGDPGGRRLACIRQNAVALIAADTGRRVVTLKGHTAEVEDAAFSPDGGRVATGGRDDLVRLWDAATGEERGALRGHEAFITRVAWSRDGRRVVSGSWDRTLRVWDVEGGRTTAVLRGHAEYVTAAAFSPDGRRVLGGAMDGGLRLWDAETGEARGEWEGHPGGVLAVAFAPDGERAASCGYDGAVRVWDAATAELVHALKGHTEAVTRLAFSPDGRRLASGGNDDAIRVWDPSTGQEKLTLRGMGGFVRWVGWSADGRRLRCGGSDGTLREYDAGPP